MVCTFEPMAPLRRGSGSLGPVGWRSECEASSEAEKRERFAGSMLNFAEKG
jgi:hypothetical protein